MKRLVVLLFAVAERAFNALLASGARTAVLLFFFLRDFFPPGWRVLLVLLLGAGVGGSPLCSCLWQRERGKGGGGWEGRPNSR